MTRIFDDPAEFASDALEGFADLYAGYVRAVPGGVVRRAKLYYLRGRTGKRARIAERKVVKTGQEG